MIIKYTFLIHHQTLSDSYYPPIKVSTKIRPLQVEQLQSYVLVWKDYFNLPQIPQADDSSTSGCGGGCGYFI
ncbi:MAG: hypothetical protein B7Z60_04230 [Ferrovum sp. 37-45-19]|nr:MAG: hypothetical protein B7Z60_04230 [Ferrovum sp. 37-45-19]